MDVSATVRAARRQLALSQRELAARLGVSSSAVASWESGSRTPTVATLVRLLDMQGLVLDTGPRAAPAGEAFTRHLRLSLTSRLRLALGEHASPYIGARGEAWHGLLALGRLGTTVVHPPVAHGIWVPTTPKHCVQVTVHQPRGELPLSAAIDVEVSEREPPSSLVLVPLQGPARVWVSPPAEMLVAEREDLRVAAALLAASDTRDLGDRRAPAHRDPDEWREAGQVIARRSREGVQPPAPELGRAWRLGGGAVSLEQSVRRRGARAGR